MMVAKRILYSDIIGPMFMPELALKELLAFVKNPRQFEPLVVIGPPKCSKTAVLHHVLPSLVAARGGDVTPVFVRLTFSLDDTPEVASKRIWQALAAVARAFDVCRVEVPAKVDFTDARSELPALFGELARLFDLKKYRLWFLLDEISV